MTLDALIMIFGAIVALLPFLQFPPDWTAALTLIAGIVVIGLGIAVRRRGKRGAPGKHSASFVDSEARDDIQA